MTHTPGPWTVVHIQVVERPVRIREHFAIRPEAGPAFAFLPEGRRDIQEGNAQILGASLQMLAALKIASAALAPLIETDPHPIALEAYNAVASAIAAAEGKK